MRMREVLRGRVGYSTNRGADSSLAVEEDWGKEYLDYMISAKTVASVDEAIEHINRYNTGHSEAIITENYTNAQKFLDEVDAAWCLCQCIDTFF